jgi:MarR family transcriptional regulator, temperature-dependent positive regulator of motility
VSRDLSDERRNRETVGEPRTLLRLLVECSRGLEARLRARLREAGYGDIRPAHYAVFRYLGPEGSRATELAEAAGMTQQSMGELVAHLEGLGFVERRPDPRDGRARIVVPTESGRGGIATAAGLLAEVEAELAERMGEERLESLVAMLGELGDLLAQTGSPPGIGK